MERLIDFAIGRREVPARVTIGDLADSDAKRVVTVKAAAMIESGWFPGEIDSDRSAYRQLTADYLGSLERLTALNNLPGMY